MDTILRLGNIPVGLISNMSHEGVIAICRICCSHYVHGFRMVQDAYGSMLLLHTGTCRRCGVQEYAWIVACILPLSCRKAVGGCGDLSSVMGLII